MQHPTEGDERRHLGEVQEKLRAALAVIERDIIDYSDNMIESKRFAWENAGMLDPVERAAYKIAMNEESIFAEMSLKERRRLQKLILSPYFGRIDFAESRTPEPSPYYIGIHSFAAAQGGHELIIDWRAPLSSMFYDFETGPAVYRAPEGDITGDITLKRQYRIRASEMEYMLESALNIGDDILQQELSRTSDDKMKNIVATIQKEQNSIIRNDTARVLIIQGAAGSGKTSIALHRVAFLLYRHKHTLKAADVLVLSPNKVFGSYISNVLPELGEENIPQTGFDELARQFLGRGRSFQTFAQQVSDLMEDGSEAMIARIRYKATTDFVEELLAFLQRCDDTCFQPEEFAVEGFRITTGQLVDEYRRLRQMPVRKRLEKMASDRVAAYERQYMDTLSTAARRMVKERIQKMFRFKNAMALYRAFYKQPGHEGLFATGAKGRLEYCDVFPLALLTLLFEGVTHCYGGTSHLLVDEMQDYTPVQYAFLARVFSCRMTILGDSYQSVNPYSSSSLERISPYFAGSECLMLHKSYRSTVEIVRFAQGIRRNDKIIPIERHGDEPLLTACADREEEQRYIATRIAAFRASAHNTLGILCKTQDDAWALYKALAEGDPDIALLDFESSEFRDGVIITSCHMAKGLEFDSVLVRGCSEEAYRTELDRSLLYIACTRAMHLLELTFYGHQSAFIAPGAILYQAKPGSAG